MYQSHVPAVWCVTSSPVAVTCWGFSNASVLVLKIEGFVSVTMILAKALFGLQALPAIVSAIAIVPAAKNKAMQRGIADDDASCFIRGPFNC